MLLYAMNNSTFTTSRKQDKSCKILKQATFVECFWCDFLAAVLIKAALLQPHIEKNGKIWF